MLRLLRPVLALLSLPLLLAPVPSRAEGLRDAEGSWARYGVESGGLPHVDQLLVSLPRVESVEDGEAVWFQMEAFSGGDPVFAVAILVSNLDFLRDGGASPVVRRYLLYPSGEEPLEYVDAANGRALLPFFGLFEGLLPVAPSSSPHPLFELESYLGRTLTPARQGTSGARPLPNLIGHHRVLSLDDRVLVGSSRPFRDDGTGREIDPLTIPPTLLDYRYVPFSESDYAQMRAAGFNLFRIPAADFDRVAREPVFFLLEKGTAAFPDLFYRSNFRGAVMYLDEPEIRVVTDTDFPSITDPAAAATAVSDFTGAMLDGAGPYGSGYLAAMLDAEGWSLGDRVPLEERNMPSWTIRQGSSWYQMEAGVRGLVEEIRGNPEENSQLVLERFGVEFPADPGHWLRFDFAMATGARERFGGDWGVSVFGQTADALADLTFPAAYERGARYFWFWSSDEGHHVPYARQLELASAFRDWRAQESGHRPRETGRLVAITLPWGYTCDQSNLRGSAPGFLWRGSGIRLDDRNAAGVEHRDVLAAFYRMAAERLAAGDEMDVIYRRPGEVVPIGSYDRIYHVLETGTVMSGATDVAEAGAALAGPLTAWPNPFRGGTALGMRIDRRGEASVRVYDAAGRLVRTVLPGSDVEPGHYSLWWNGRDGSGAVVGSGVYFVRAVAGGEEKTSKIVRLR